MQEHDTSNDVAHELRRWTPEELLEARAAIDELEQMPGFQVVMQLAEQVRTRKLDSLVTSSALREAAEYARELGEISGIQVIEAIVSTVRAKAARADEQLAKQAAGAAA